MAQRSGDRHLQREAPTAHKFKVQMYDFLCEELAVDGTCDAYLKIDFDNFKIFKTDAEPNTLNPEWGFKAGFQYLISFLEKLGRRELWIQCFNRASSSLIGEASVDLQTVACGPAYFKLTLKDPASKEARGICKFTCVMKMMSPNLTVIVKELSLCMQGFPAPARMNVDLSIADGDNASGKPEDQRTFLKLPHSQEGTWAGPVSLSLETTLGDLLKAPETEFLHFEVIDDMGVRQGESYLEFRKAFSTKPDVSIPFKVPVTYTTTQNETEERYEPVGAVGELEGVVQYQNLPIYAQMAGGLCCDSEVEGGYWLIEGLPYPHCMASAPPIWQETHITDRHGPGVDCFSTDPQPHEEADQEAIGDADDLDSKAIWEALEQIDLPPPWEKRRERGDVSGGRMYFADPRSRRTTWKDPRFLPENWDQRIDPQTGKVYFQYHKTRNTTYADPRGCPAGWDMRLSKNGDIYFAFLPAMMTTFIDPRGLPDSVDPALDDYGRMYFKNHEAKTTSWEDPREAAQEVTLAKWRQAQSARWWKEQVWREIEEISKQRCEMEARRDEDEELDAGG